MKTSNIEIPGYADTWYLIDSKRYNIGMLYMLESEIFGDETSSMIVDENLNILYEDIWNGWDDFDYILSESDTPEYGDLVRFEKSHDGHLYGVIRFVLDGGSYDIEVSGGATIVLNESEFIVVRA